LKILIIGFGSIGKRHYDILSKFKNSKIDVVSKQRIHNINIFTSLEDIDNLNIYDYFIIASETIKHFKQLKYIISKVDNNKILVEKPLFSNFETLDIKNNSVFVAYNLRFHPVLNKIYQLIKNETIYFANIICGQYLPTWRNNRDYRESYSSSLKKGGGVLRDLSHELDYTTWLFGNLSNFEYINAKVSDLEISSDDIFSMIGITENKIIVNLTVDYISKKAIRELIIHTKNKTLKVDIINNSIIEYNKKGNESHIKLQQKKSNYTYKQMHKNILFENGNRLASFQDGFNIVKMFEKIKFMESI